MSFWDHLSEQPLDTVPLAFVDVETTGLRANRGDRICEVGIAVYRGEEEVLSFSTLVNPCRPISAGAAAVNGLRDADLRSAPTFPEIASSVAVALSAGVLVAHNATFDLSFLSNELALAGLPPTAPGALDTMVIAKRLFPFGRHGLNHLARALELPSNGQAHRAMADALTARALLWRLAGLIGRGEVPQFGALAALQGQPTPWPAPVEEAPPKLPSHMASLLKPGARLHIVYVDPSGRRSERLIEPIDVYSTDETTYLVAFCHLRGEQRTFRVDRILGCEPG